MPRSSRTAWATCLLAVALGPAGCSSGDDKVEPAQTTANRPLTEEDRLVERQLVTEKELASHRAGSAERAFLEYMSALDYEDWSTAVRFLDVTLRRVLEPEHLIPALRIESQNNPPVKPVIRNVRRVRGHVSIRYMVRDGDGRLRPTSSSWEQRDGVWHLIYSSTLDDSYAAAVQQAVQFELDPTARTPSKTALRAGADARRAQARALKLEPAPTPRRRPRATPTPTATPAG